MTEPLQNLTVRPSTEPPRATGDLLSQVLAQIRLTGDHVRSRSLAASEQLELDEGEGFIVVVTAGSLEMVWPGQPTAVLEAGDLTFLPRGPGEIRLVAPGPRAAVAVCRFWFDPDSLRGMLLALPQCIHIRRAEGKEWIEGMLHFLTVEADDVQPGGALMISRVIDLIVIRVLRTWVHQGHTSGWLGGLSDARIAKSLKAIHDNPMRRWSIVSLADVAGMSRSSFCDRFTTLVGRSPLRYQNDWRLGLARDMLMRGDARVGEVGLRIGYESESAFSRAYKQHFGQSPREVHGSPGGVETL